MKKTIICIASVFVCLVILIVAVMAKQNNLKTESEYKVTISGSDQTDELLKQIENLQADNAELKEIILKSNNTSLNLELEAAKLEETNLNLQSNISELENKNDALEASNLAFSKEVSRLKQEKASIQQELEEAKTTNANLQNMLAQKEEIIEDLNSKEFDLTRVKVENSFWEKMGGNNGRHGTFWFSDLSNVEKVEVSYKNSMFFDVEVEGGKLVLDTAQNKACVTYYIMDESEAQYPQMCVFEIFYKNGRSETIVTKITMG